MMRKSTGIQRWIKIVLAIVVALILMPAHMVEGKNVFTRTYVYKPFRPKTSAAAIEFLNTMKQIGYNGWMFDSRIIRDPKIVSESVKADLARVVAHAKKLHIALTPMSQQQNELTYSDINFAEAYPSKDARFVVAGTKANLVADPVSMVNPGFESGTTGWSKSALFNIDNSVKHSGGASICVSEALTRAAISQSVSLKPYTTYEVSVWIKTSNFTEPRNLGLAVQGGANWLHHIREPRGVKSTQDWRIHRISFCSMNFTRALIMVVGTENVKSTGKAWFDDVAIREVALYEAVNRSTVRPVVKSLSGIKFQEGKDYEITIDPAVKPHNQGKLLIPAGSSLKNGDTLLVDWYKLSNNITAKPPATLGHPEAWTLFDKHVRLVDEMFDNPVGRMMKYSEWKGLAAWDPGVQQQFSSTGTYWAWIFKETENLYRKANPNREVYIWNDEVDPYHNGEKPQIEHWKGNHGAYKGLSEETVIVNWNATDFKMNSLRFFAGIDPKYPQKKNMQRQIISPGAFAPNDGNGGWKSWLPILDQAEADKANPLPDGAVIGILYHTFRDNYTELDVMKNACAKAGRWAPEFPFKPREVGIAPKASAAAPGALSIRVSNPARSNGQIQYALKHDGQVHLKVVNSRGQVVRMLVDNKRQSAGRHSMSLDASQLPSGVYFVNLKVDRGASQITKKVVVF